jgi:hypothetical protein
MDPCIKIPQLCEQFLVGSFLLVLSTLSLSAQSNNTDGGYSYGLYGTPGLIDMPTAQSADDAEIAATISHFAGTTRTTLSFQISPRLSGSFRYSRIEKFLSDKASLYDRSFDLRYRMIDEGAYRPAIAIGLQDIIGTGIYSGEYIVATKQIMPTFEVTAGLGWGRLGSSDGFSNPLGFIDERFESRPGGFTGTGGQIESARWFRGDAALFGGIKWQATDELRLMAEYSSDAYLRERTPRRDLFERDSPLNFGLSYALANGTALQAHYLYGSEIGVGLTFALNPRHPAVYGSTAQRPTPVEPQDPEDIASLEWTRQSGAPEILRSNLQQSLQAEGITLEAATFAPTSATVLVRNDTYSAGSEVIGRTARIMARLLPASVQDFTIVPVEAGIKAAAIRIARTDLEELEFAKDNVSHSFARAQLDAGGPSGTDATDIDDLYPSFQWRLGPYLSASYFDPDSPVRADIGLELSASYTIAPGLSLAGDLRKRIGGNVGEGRKSNSVIQRVRTDAVLYAAQGDPSLTRLTADYKTNLGSDLYGRLTVGYLESMYAGLSAEALWKPVDSALGFGLEVNYARQRDFDQMFGLQDYDVVTGHASAYYAFENSFHAQLDVGRYLAGDYGATLALDREFDNGWRVGAFATFTDVSFDDFGEGSFDKGLRFSVPLEYFTGTPSKRVSRSTIRPLTRDGGARLNVEGRLYETVRGFHTSDLEGNWGRFWR